MTSHIKILRTHTGYQLGDLHATGLTPRESQALLLKTQGLSVGECAQLMNCSKASVQDRISTLFYKLNVNNTPELITKAFQSGFLKFLTLIAALNLSAAVLNDHSFNRVRTTRTHIVRIQIRTKEFV